MNHFIKKLENINELIRIKEYVSPELEICEIVDRVSKQKDGGKALLFENNGTDFPVLINALGSEKRICTALHVSDLNQLPDEIEQLIKTFTSSKNSFIEKAKFLPKLIEISSWMPKSIKGKGLCQEVIIKNPDLSILPVLKCWPYDGGRFITLPIVHTKNPITGIRNAGMYRMQIFSKDLTGMHWHKHKTGANHYAEYKNLNKPMPIAVALGGDPVYTYCATAPLPENIDEYLLAGFLRKKRVELVSCITQDIEVPADADIIIEGYVNPNEDLIWEGPFGDHTGFYSLPDWYPKFHVTCITHKRNAVYPATIVGIPPMEDAVIAKATERIFLSPIKFSIIPEMIDMDIPAAGVAHNLTIAKIKKSFPGQALKTMNALWGAGQMMFNKNLIIVDENADIHNYVKLAEIISLHVTPASDIHFSYGPMDVLDHSSVKFAYGSKMCIDATKKMTEEILFNSPNIIDKTEIFNDESLKRQFNEIVEINTELLKLNISAIIISVQRNSDINSLIEKMVESKILATIKFIFFVDETVDVFDLWSSVWLISNNIDPKRDTRIVQDTNTKISQIYFDATRKIKNQNRFEREWPNIITMDDVTINKIDKIWNKLGFDSFIPSPSLKFRKMVVNEGAIVKE